MSRLPTVRGQWEALAQVLREQGYSADKVDRAKPLFDYCMTASLTMTVAAAKRHNGSTRDFAYWLQQVEAEALTMGYLDVAAAHTRPRRRPPPWEGLAAVGSWLVLGVVAVFAVFVMVEFSRMALDTQSFCHGQGYIEVK